MATQSPFTQEMFSDAVTREKEREARQIFGTLCYFAEKEKRAYVFQGALLFVLKALILMGGEGEEFVIVFMPETLCICSEVYLISPFQEDPGLLAYDSCF